MWMYLGLLTALFLGLHNLCKKHAVKDNDVFKVLIGTSGSGLLLLLPLLILSRVNPEYTQEIDLYIPELSFRSHVLIFIKSSIMACSWVLAYQALKHLPISIVSPIRAGGPFFTFIGAIVIYNESPKLFQWIGFFLIMFSVYLYSRVGKKEGIVFKSNKWIYAIIGATFLGASSGLYDKYLVQYVDFNPQTLQFWFTFYVVIILSIIVLVRTISDKEKRKGFKFRWSIPAVGLFLQLADYFYFKALQDPEALIMLLSAIKRSQLLIAAVAGGIIFKEKNKRKKLIPLAGVMIGVFLILFS